MHDNRIRSAIMDRVLAASTSFGLTIGLALAVTLAPTDAHAREDGAPAAALGQADAVRASGVGTSALYFNPAGMSTIRQYSFEAGYSLLQDVTDGHAFGVSAVDSATNGNLAMGLGYNYITSKQGNVDRDGHSARFALATGYGGQDWSFSVGVGGRYLDLARGGDTSDVEFFTVDAGLIFQLGNILRLGVAGQNLIDTKAISEAPRKVGFGAAARFSSLELSFDTELDIQTYEDETPATFLVGAQYFFEQGIVVRAGFAADGLRDQNRFAVGASYVSATIGADLAYTRATDDSGDSIFSASFKYFLP